MATRRRHLIATIGLAALALLCFGACIWALLAGAVVANFPGNARVRADTAGHQYMPANTVYTREDAPAVYWGVVGLLGGLGTFFAGVACLEHRSWRHPTQPRAGEAANASLLARIDAACHRFPEQRETLLRARAVLIEVNSPALERSLNRMLDKLLKAPSRDAASREIDHLKRALDLASKL